MVREEGFVYLNAAGAAKVRKATWIAFGCLLAVPAVLAVMMFVSSGFWDVFLVLTVAALAADGFFVLANGLCYASRYAFSVSESAIRVRCGLCCRKLAVIRYSDALTVRVKRYFNKKNVGGRVQEYEGSGASALRFLSDADGVYDIRILCGSGKFTLRRLSREAAAAALSYFEDLHDERKLTDANQ